jgi:hypothetical protein
MARQAESQGSADSDPGGHHDVGNNKARHNGGAHLKQHRRLALPGKAPQFHLGRVVSGQARSALTA